MKRRGFRRPAAGLLAAGLFAAAWASGQEEPRPERGKLTSHGGYWVTWISEPDPIPLNEMFELRFRVFRADDRQTLVPGAVLTAGAFMPAHNHGTTLQPRVESHGDGTATARGFLLQMEGFWELRVGVAVGGQMERATFEIHLEP